jgi:hypothetical protein
MNMNDPVLQIIAGVAFLVIIRWIPVSRYLKARRMR